MPNEVAAEDSIRVDTSIHSYTDSVEIDEEVPVVEPEVEEVPVAPINIEPLPATIISIPLSLNDTFRFAREWFDGDAAQLRAFWAGFSSCKTYAEAENYVKTHIDADDDDETLSDCLLLLKQYYPLV